MAKVIGPALSLGARGTVGNALTFQKKMGGHSVYAHKQKKDARSYPQMLIRSYMRNAVDAWHALTAAERGQWNDFIAGIL